MKQFNEEDNERKTITLPPISDRFGEALEYIMIIPLYGDQYMFTDYKEVLVFIDDIYEKTTNMDMRFNRVEMIINYQNGMKMHFETSKKDDIKKYIKLLFDPAE